VQEEAPALTQTPSAPALKPLDEIDPLRPFAEKYPGKWQIRKTHGSKLGFYYNRRPSVTERKGIYEQEPDYK